MVRGELMELPRDPAIKIESKRKVQKAIEPICTAGLAELNETVCRFSNGERCRNHPPSVDNPHFGFPMFRAPSIRTDGDGRGLITLTSASPESCL